MENKFYNNAGATSAAQANADVESVVSVSHLKKYFPIARNFFGKPIAFLRAVEDISFELKPGTTLGIVGESGCGKTTMGRTMLRLYDTTGGRVIYKNLSVEKLSTGMLKSLMKKSVDAFHHRKTHDELLALIGDKVDLSLLTHRDLSCMLAATVNMNRADAKEIVEAFKYGTREDLEVLVKCLDAPISALSRKALRKYVCRFEDRKCRRVPKHELDSMVRARGVNPVGMSERQMRTFLWKDRDENKYMSANREELILLVKEWGVDINGLSRAALRRLRPDIQLVFQDPYSSLPPRMTVGNIIAEAVRVHKIVPKDQVYEYVLEVMKMCGLRPQFYSRYPHEFSGGQRQRICIARALAVKPKIVICDEPVSALDVSIQAQIINLLKHLQQTMGLTYLFISHDLSVVKYITDSIMVMYLGNMMETGNTEDIFENPLHPYTKALFSAVPIPDPAVKMNRIILEGDIPSPANPPRGCKFHTRCSECMEVCRHCAPRTSEPTPGHRVNCHLYDEEVMQNPDKFIRAAKGAGSDDVAENSASQN